MNKLIEYIILGIVQGFSEPLPISSSGHLVLFQEMFGMAEQNLNLEIILNFASLIAIIYFYRKDILSLIINNYNFIFKNKIEYKKDFIYILLVIVASIPAGIAGLLFKDSIISLKTSLVVGISLLITALALFSVNMFGGNNKNFKLTFKNAIFIGVAQAFALVPGISRSGSTLVGGLSQKINSDSVLKFSFLMYIPISIATMALGITDLNFSDIDLIGYLISFLITIISTYISLLLLYKIVKSQNLHYFSYYCFIVGSIAIIFNILR